MSSTFKLSKTNKNNKNDESSENVDDPDWCNPCSSKNILGSCWLVDCCYNGLLIYSIFRLG